VLRGRHNRYREDTDKAYCDTFAKMTIHNLRFRTANGALNFEVIASAVPTESPSPLLSPSSLRERAALVA
jgi:hypothetical protein